MHFKDYSKEQRIAFYQRLITLEHGGCNEPNICHSGNCPLYTQNLCNGSKYYLRVDKAKEFLALENPHQIKEI